VQAEKGEKAGQIPPFYIRRTRDGLYHLRAVRLPLAINIPHPASSPSKFRVTRVPAEHEFHAEHNFPEDFS
jgi:hypothetical protein